MLNTRRSWLVNSYVWSSQTTDAHYEADNVESVVPGPGMLSNCFPNLANIQMSPVSVDSAGLHRWSDPGVGSFSNFHNINFLAKQFIPAGMEFFSEYGEEWFVQREHMFGRIPLSRDYSLADKILEKYFDFIGDDINTSFAIDLWKLINQDLIENELVKAAMPA
eukprot:13986196-Ditylum_brightwellii.AAC.1